MVYFKKNFHQSILVIEWVLALEVLSRPFLEDFRSQFLVISLAQSQWLRLLVWSSLQSLSGRLWIGSWDLTAVSAGLGLTGLSCWVIKKNIIHLGPGSVEACWSCCKSPVKAGAVVSVQPASFKEVGLRAHSEAGDNPWLTEGWSLDHNNCEFLAASLEWNPRGNWRIGT